MVRHVPRYYFRKTASFATVQGTDTYSLAADVLEPLVFHYTLNNIEYVLTKIESEREYWQVFFSRAAAQYRPLFYFQSGVDGSGNKQITLFQIPDTAYTINYAYYKDPTRTELGVSDLNNELPDFPSYTHDAIIHGALWLFLKNFDDEASSDRAKAEFGEAIIQLDESENADQDSELSIRMDPNRRPYLSGNGIKLV